MAEAAYRCESYSAKRWYKSMSFEYHNCWYCGRSGLLAPDGWYGPWLIERAHIVASPRVEDRRVIVMLCSLCHRTQHGDRVVLPATEEILPKLSLSQMLGLKEQHDPEWYDREFIEAHHIGRLPRKVKPR